MGLFSLTLDCACVVTERSGGHADPFDIVERVEMGQMASMFFHKGNYSPGLQAPNLTSYFSITCKRRLR